MREQRMLRLHGAGIVKPLKHHRDRKFAEYRSHSLFEITVREKGTLVKRIRVIPFGSYTPAGDFETPAKARKGIDEMLASGGSA
jgi:hypothetical protein